MPYPSNSNLPPAVQKLPTHQQDIFRKAFNSALAEYKDEQKAFKVAWSAVNKSKEAIIDQSSATVQENDMPQDTPAEAPELKPNGSKAQPHDHNHFHDDGTAHKHPHTHDMGMEHEAMGSVDEPAMSHQDHAPNMACDEAGLPMKLKKNNPPFPKDEAPAGDTPPEETPAEDKNEVPADEKPKEEEEKVKNAVRTSYFGELIDLREAVIDKNTQAIEVTMIKPGWSKNGHYYSPDVLKQALPLFEGSKCFINHPTLSEDKERPERSVTDLVGWYENVKQGEDGSLKGTLRAVKRESVEKEILPLVRAAIEENPTLIGESINVLGKGSLGYAEGKHGKIVTEIAYVAGTDIVTSPSAGGKFERLLASGDELTSELLKNLTYEEWRESRPEFSARIKKEMQTARKDELESVALKEATDLKTRLEEKDRLLKAKEEEVNQVTQDLTDKVRASEDRVNELVAAQKLTESGLPKEWSEKLLPDLKAKKPEEMDALITTEKDKYFQTVQVKVENKDVQLNREAVFQARYGGIANSLGVDVSGAPREGETPEQYAARMKRK